MVYLEWTYQAHADGLTVDQVTKQGTKYTTGAETAMVCCAMPKAYDLIGPSYALDDKPVF
jgi:hypothetical protein